MHAGNFLTRVQIENYKSIARCDVRLGPLSYLVGPNGSGKSNFLDALRFVAEALKQSVGQALRTRGGGGAICHAPNRAEGYFRIGLEFMSAAGAGAYTLQVACTMPGKVAGSWEVVEEELRLPGAAETRSLSGTSSALRSVFGDRLGLALVADQPAYLAAYAGLTQMCFYSLQPKAIEDVVSFEPMALLRPDGANVASVLWRLAHQEGKANERVVEYLRVLLPSLYGVRVEPVVHEGQEGVNGAQKVSLLFEQRVGETVGLYYPSQMSEGTLAALGNLTALGQALGQEPRPSVVALEEPEAAAIPARGEKGYKRGVGGVWLRELRLEHFVNIRPVRHERNIFPAA